MEGSGDSFEYLLQLTKTLSSQAWSARQQTDKVEQSLKRLAKQHYIPYKEYSKPPTAEALDEFAQIKAKSPEELIVEENYRLMYQIQQQEYIHSKVCLLVQQINEMIVSIRDFIVEYKATAPHKHQEFVAANVANPVQSLSSAQTALEKGHNVANKKVAMLIEELVLACKNVPWNKIEKDDLAYQRFKSLVKDFEDKYNIQLVSESLLLT
ncbi:factor arrest protein 3 [Kluyveromyces marxianus DMKU3-1042]|uniref:Factor arrest protein 3 n=1 Tax=Kluyveromyces marxianus (strain DMKU3-1042 / BCC 29191 / NBRC 104275) TaxID=1003335 RepID=W0TDR4_KLUMD|nr:factor arrest protein 3 [Kluyveromyces marxianus DMKU3-1042]BAO41485.1 factor arrest protein 3 [Kluyveromyces marxianus DMKU3-1042]